MKTSLKRILSLILALVMCFSIFPANAFAEEASADAAEEVGFAASETAELIIEEGAEADTEPEEELLPTDVETEEELTEVVEFDPAEENVPEEIISDDIAADGIYLIDSGEKLGEFARLVNSGDEDAANACVVLDSDIVLSGAWTPIGNDQYPFTGSFDGRGFKICGLTSFVGSAYSGLFGVTENAVLSKLALENVNIQVSGVESAAAIVGKMRGGTLSESYVTGYVNSSSGITGGLVGILDGGVIENCYNTAEVYGYDTAGGIAGAALNGAAISCCYGSGYTMTEVWLDMTGNIVGRLENSVLNNSYAVGGMDYQGRTIYAEDAHILQYYIGFDFEIVWTRGNDGRPALQNNSSLTAEAPLSLDGAGGTHRALLIGQEDYHLYCGSTEHDLTAFQGVTALKKALLNTDDYWSISANKNFTIAQIKSAIKSSFSGSKTGDVNLFFYEGHGIPYGSGTKDINVAGGFTGIDSISKAGYAVSYITPKQLASMLSAYNGHFIVILGSCGSGSFIYSGVAANAAGADESAYIDAVIDAFEEADERNVLSGMGELRNSKFSVITACAYNQSAWGWIGDPAFSIYGISKSGGYDYMPHSYTDTRTKMYGDTNADNSVTIYEAYRYAQTVVNDLCNHVQTMQYYNGDTVLFRRNEELAVLNTPSISSIQNDDNCYITLKWGSISKATNYEVYRSTSASGTYTKIGSTASTSYTDKNVSGSNYYYYKVKATGKDAESPLSSYKGIQHIYVLDSGSCGISATWKLYSDYRLVIGGSGAIMDYLTEYHTPWDDYRDKITKLEFTGSISRIGNNAFQGLSKITSVSLSSSIKELGGEVFEGCTKLEKITLPPDMVEMEADCFDNCSSLTSVTLPGTLNSLYLYYPFDGCTSLTAINVTTVSPEQKYYSVDGALYYYEKNGSHSTRELIKYPQGKKGAYEIAEGTTEIQSHAFDNCTGLTSVYIPGTVEDGAGFDNCPNLTSIEFGHTAGAPLGLGSFRCASPTATAITVQNKNQMNPSLANYDWAGDNRIVTWYSALDDNTVASGTFAGNLKWALTVYGELVISGNGTLPDYADDLQYYWLGEPWKGLEKQIKYITIQEGITGLGKAAFWYCKDIITVSLPSTLRDFGQSFASNTALSEFIVDPANPVFSSYDGVLFNKDKTELIKCPFGKSGVYTVPETVQKLGDCAFIDCAELTAVELPEGLSTIEKLCFDSCEKLERVVFPSTLAVIGRSAFRDCPLLNGIRLPEGLIEIGETAFSYCIVLDEITIPASVTSIGGGAFEGCTALREINVDYRNTSFRSIDGVLYNASGTTLIACPSGKTGEFVVPEIVSALADYAFSGCHYLTAIYFSDAVIGDITLGESAFLGCISLEKIDLTDRVVNFPEGTFDRCHALQHVDIPSRVTSIGDFAFYGSGIRSIDIPSGVTSIGIFAFENCYQLEKLVIPEGVTSIGREMCYCCYNLVSVELPGSLKAIPDRAFDNCDKLQSVKFSKGLETIGENAFSYCKSLTSLSLPEGLLSIGDGAFNCCESLRSVYFPASLSHIPDEFFLDPLSLIQFGHSKSDALTIDRSALGSENSIKIIVPDKNSMNAAISGYSYYARTVIFMSASERLSLSGCTVTLDTSSAIYDGKAKEPVVTVKRGTETLTENVDYTVSYANNVNAGTGQVTVSGIGLYTGTKSASFTIGKAEQTVSASVYPGEIPVGETAWIDILSAIGSLSYSSLTPSVVTVDADGTVTAVGGGTGKIKITAAGDSNYKAGTTEVSVTVKSTLAGDMNGDGEVTTTDVVRLMKYVVAEGEGVELKANGDVDGSGSISTSDVVRLMKYVVAEGEGVQIF